MTTLPPDHATEPHAPAMDLRELTEALRAYALASGEAGVVAAVELLVEHDRWLNISEVRRHVTWFANEDDPDSPPMAKLHWAAVVAAMDAGEMPNAGGSAGDRVMRIAASLGGGVPVDLLANLSPSLGLAHAEMVFRAFRRATIQL